MYSASLTCPVSMDRSSAVSLDTYAGEILATTSSTSSCVKRPFTSRFTRRCTTSSIICLGKCSLSLKIRTVPWSCSPADFIAVFTSECHLSTV